MSLLRPLNVFLTLTRKALLPTASVNYRKFSREEDKSEVVDPKDRSRVIDVETSIRYMKSSAYKKTYQDDLVWEPYRRNFKGQFPPKTRKTCIRKQRISTGSPCPICRDEYLVVHYKNIDLLKQFISPHGGHVLPTSKTGVCQKRHSQLLVEIQKAWNCGLITYDVPHRSYDYNLYYQTTASPK